MELLTTATFPKYSEWWAKAVVDPSTRRFLGNGGWRQPLEKVPSEWESLYLISDRACASITFDRSAASDISIGLFVIGDEKCAAAAVAIRHIAAELRRHSYFRFIRTQCMVTNEASMRLNKQLFGEPWGVSPEEAWDEAERLHVGVARFAVPLSKFLDRIPL